jgi:hypothetical protein
MSPKRFISRSVSTAGFSESERDRATDPVASACHDRRFTCQ